MIKIEWRCNLKYILGNVWYAELWNYISTGMTVHSVPCWHSTQMSTIRKESVYSPEIWEELALKYSVQIPWLHIEFDR